MKLLDIQTNCNANTAFLWLFQEPIMDPIEINLGESYEPVRCIIRCSLDRKVIASCGAKIIVLETKRGVAVENIFNTLEKK